MKNDFALLAFDHGAELRFALTESGISLGQTNVVSITADAFGYLRDVGTESASPYKILSSGYRDQMEDYDQEMLIPRVRLDLGNITLHLMRAIQAAKETPLKLLLDSYFEWAAANVNNP